MLPVHLSFLKSGDALAVTPKAPAVVGTVSVKTHVVFGVLDVSVGLSLDQSGLRLTHWVSLDVVTVNDAVPPAP